MLSAYGFRPIARVQSNRANITKDVQLSSNHIKTTLNPKEICVGDHVGAYVGAAFSRCETVPERLPQLGVKSSTRDVGRIA